MKKLLFVGCSLLIVIQAKVHILQNDMNIKKGVISWIEIKNKNLTRQKYDYSCGSASLSTILKYYYYQNISEKQILESVMKMKGITKENIVKKYKEDNGLSFLDLSSFVKDKGFKALGLALDMDALKKLQIPVILYVKIRKSEHFTVYKGMDDRYAYLADPTMGNTKVRLSKFKEMFYQREDLAYPGKILAILPLSETIVAHKDFMIFPKASSLVYKSIGLKMLKK